MPCPALELSLKYPPNTETPDGAMEINGNKPVLVSFGWCFGSFICPAVCGSDLMQSYLQLFVYNTEAVKCSC